ncbi:MAG TPA: hypothetical protein VF875_00535 [Anaeromyxobacter sp.]
MEVLGPFDGGAHERLAQLAREQVRVVQITEHVLKPLQVIDRLARVGVAVAPKRLEEVAQPLPLDARRVYGLLVGRATDGVQPFAQCLHLIADQRGEHASEARPGDGTRLDVPLVRPEPPLKLLRGASVPIGHACRSWAAAGSRLEPFDEQIEPGALALGRKRHALGPQPLQLDLGIARLVGGPRDPLQPLLVSRLDTVLEPGPEGAQRAAQAAKRHPEVVQHVIVVTRLESFAGLARLGEEAERHDARTLLRREIDRSLIDPHGLTQHV